MLIKVIKLFNGWHSIFVNDPKGECASVTNWEQKENTASF